MQTTTKTTRPTLTTHSGLPLNAIADDFRSNLSITKFLFFFFHIAKKSEELQVMLSATAAATTTTTSFLSSSHLCWMESLQQDSFSKKWEKRKQLEAANDEGKNFPWYLKAAVRNAEFYCHSDEVGRLGFNKGFWLTRPFCSIPDCSSASEIHIQQLYLFLSLCVR